MILTKIATAMVMLCMYLLYLMLNIMELPFRTARHTAKGFKKHFTKNQYCQPLKY